MNDELTVIVLTRHRLWLNGITFDSVDVKLVSGRREIHQSETDALSQSSYHRPRRPLRAALVTALSTSSTDGARRAGQVPEQLVLVYFGVVGLENASIHSVRLGH